MPSCSDNPDSHFTPEEIAKYTRRMEEGYDLTDDLRYNHWLSLQLSATNENTCNNDVMTRTL